MSHNIRTKKTMYEKFLSGFFGNIDPHWESIQEWLDSEYTGKVGIRDHQRSGAFYPDVPFEKVLDTLRDNEFPRGFTISPMFEKADYILHGEVFKCPDWIMYYSTAREHKRVALKDYGNHAYGLFVPLIIQQHTNWNSWEDFRELVELYPDSVIEFSCLNKNRGTIPSRNMIIWEVRNY